MSTVVNYFLENILLPLGDLVNGTDTISQLKYWRRVSALSEKEIEDLSRNNLSAILNYSIQNIPYYKQYQGTVKDDPIEMLHEFPVMKKDTIRNNLDYLVSSPISTLIKYSSSGSSGIQGTVYMNKKEEAVIRAIMLLWWEWAGYYIGKPTVQTGMTTDRGLLKSLKDLLLKVKYVTAFNLSEEEVLKTLNTLGKKSNMQLAGYPSSLNVFAETALKNAVDDVKFDSAICWGDKLFDHHKKNIKKAFNCDVFETYSCNEGFLVGAKKDLDFFYIMSPHVYVEIVDDEGHALPDGEMGHVLLTRLDCFSMPLIRYYIGDLAIKLPGDKYPAKREMNFPLLERVIGRDTDVVETASGKKLIVHFFTGIFEFVPEIVQFKVIQRDFSGIEIEYIPGPGFSDAVLSGVEMDFYDKLKEKLNVTWKKVERILPSPSGKPQLIEVVSTSH